MTRLVALLLLPLCCSAEWLALGTGATLRGYYLSSDVNSNGSVVFTTCANGPCDPQVYSPESSTWNTLPLPAEQGWPYASYWVSDSLLLTGHGTWGFAPYVAAYRLIDGVWRLPERVGQRFSPGEGCCPSGAFGSINSIAAGPSLTTVGSPDWIDVTLYAGGNFRDPTNVAMWTGSGQWQDMGGGVSGYGSYVRALAVSTDGATVYVAGSFSIAGNSLAVNNIAEWSGNTWSWSSMEGGVGVGGSNSVLGLAFYRGSLIAVGAFGRAGSVDASSVAAWSIASRTWSSMGSGFPGQQLWSVTASDDFGVFVTGGLANVYQWTAESATWTPLQPAFNVAAVGMVKLAAGSLYAAGLFQSAGSVTVNLVARYPLDALPTLAPAPSPSVSSTAMPNATNSSTVAFNVSASASASASATGSATVSAAAGSAAASAAAASPAPSLAPSTPASLSASQSASPTGSAQPVLAITATTTPSAAAGVLYEVVLSFQLCVPMTATGVTTFWVDASYAIRMRGSVAAGLNASNDLLSNGGKPITAADVLIDTLFDYSSSSTIVIAANSSLNAVAPARRLGHSEHAAVHGRAAQIVPSSGLGIGFKVAVKAPSAGQASAVGYRLATNTVAQPAAATMLLAQFLSDTTVSASLGITTSDLALNVSTVTVSTPKLVYGSDSGDSGISGAQLGLYLGAPLAAVATLASIAAVQLLRVRRARRAAATAVRGAGADGTQHKRKMEGSAGPPGGGSGAEAGGAGGGGLHLPHFSQGGIDGGGGARSTSHAASYVGAGVRDVAEGAAAAGLGAAVHALAPTLTLRQPEVTAFVGAAVSEVSSGLAEAAHAVADGVASLLEAAAPSVPLIGAAMVALTQVYREVQRVKANSVECKRLAERIARLHSMLKQVGDDEPFVSRHTAIFQSLLATLEAARSSVVGIADRSTASAFISARSDAAALNRLDADITHHIAELSAAMQAETLTAVRVIHDAVSGQHANAAPAAPPPPFSMQFNLKDFAFDPPLEHQKLHAPRGSYGVVVTGTWRANRLPVAIKLLPARGPSGELLISISVWLSEAELMRRLRESKGPGHVPAHIVLLYGIGVVEGPLGADTYLVVMELMKCSLREALNRYLREGRLPALARVLSWLLETAHGLCECHAASVVHSDIKAANVLISDSYEAKLGDLGTARVTRGIAATMSKGGTATAVGARGSPLWLAPELVADSDLSPSTASDVYSWAITAWEILSCCLPYHDREGNLLVNVDKLQSRLDLVGGRLRPDLSAVRRDCPPAIVALMQRAWASDPQQRPPISTIVQELQAAVDAHRVAQAAATTRLSSQLAIVELPGTSV